MPCWLGARNLCLRAGGLRLWRVERRGRWPSKLLLLLRWLLRLWRGLLLWRLPSRLRRLLWLRGSLDSLNRQRCRGSLLKLLLLLLQQLPLLLKLCLLLQPDALRLSLTLLSCHQLHSHVQLSLPVTPTTPREPGLPWHVACQGKSRRPSLTDEGVEG